MTPTCSIGSAIRDQRLALRDAHPVSPNRTWGCHGPLAPIQIVSEDALVGKFRNGVMRRAGREWYKVLSAGQAEAARYSADYDYLSLDQLRELLTVGGPCERCGGRVLLTCEEVGHSDPKPGMICMRCPRCGGTGRDTFGCEKHRAMLEPTRAMTGQRFPPALKLTDLLRGESSGQWCRLHGCHQDDPAHSYAYPTCERYLRDATPDEEAALPPPALTEAMEWAQKLGLTKDGPDRRHDPKEAA